MLRHAFKAILLFAVIVSEPAQAQLLEILNTVKTATDTFNAVSGVVGKVTPATAPAVNQQPTGSLSSMLPVGAVGDTSDEPKLIILTGTQKTSLEQKQSFCVNGNKVAAFPYEGDYQGVALILNVNGTERIIPLQSTNKNLEGHHSLWGGTPHIGQVNGYQLKVSKLDPTLFSFEVTKLDDYKKSYMTKVC
jgi:hypothetical protein